MFFFFFEGRNGTVVFWRWQFFRRDGVKSLHRPAKGGLNRPASRPCKDLVLIAPSYMNQNYFGIATKFSLGLINQQKRIETSYLSHNREVSTVLKYYTEICSTTQQQ